MQVKKNYQPSSWTNSVTPPKKNPPPCLMYFFWSMFYLNFFLKAGPSCSVCTAPYSYLGAPLGVALCRIRIIRKPDSERCSFSTVAEEYHCMPPPRKYQVLTACKSWSSRLSTPTPPAQRQPQLQEALH